MSWLLPSALAIAGIGAIAAIALHFIARSRPLAEPLPTARFIPERPVHARMRSIKLSDVPLLLLRLAALLALGAAVAGPVFAGATGTVTRVIVADRSRAVANIDEVRDSVRAVLRAGDVLIVFDSAASVATLDSLRAVPLVGSVSAALASAIRGAAAIAPRTDSLELVIVSPLVSEELDDATAHIRAAWPGRARLVRTAAAVPAAAGVRRVETTATAEDPVVAGLALAGLLGPRSDVRLVRGRVPAGDSAWARDSGHVLIHWPSTDESSLWPKRPLIDAIGGVASSGGAMVARFPRLWVIDGQAIARWADGEPAAVERPLGNGCIRDVALVFDPASDATLRPPFREFIRPLLAPCGGGARDATPLDSAAVAPLAGSGALAAGASLRDRSAERSRWTPWLLFAAAGLLILELAARRTEKATA